MLKKNMLIIILVLSLFLLVGCRQSKSIKLFNCGEYLAPAIKKAFYQKTGIKVIEVTYDANEIALTSIKAGNSYDLVVLSDYAINELKETIINKKQLLRPIDWSKISAINKDDLASELHSVIELFAQSSKYSILDYAIPYFWGDFGILYNPQKITPEKVQTLEWNILFETKTSNNNPLKVAIYDSSTDLFTVALKALNKEISKANTADIKAAKEWLNKIPRVNRNFITDEIFDDLPNAIYDVTLAYLGDAAEIIARIEEEKLDVELSYYCPKQMGSNVWLDGIILPDNGDNSEQDKYIYQFLNFLLTEDIALQNAEELGYPSPLRGVLQAQKDNSSPKIKTMLDVKLSPKHEMQIYPRELKKQIDFEWVVFRCS